MFAQLTQGGGLKNPAATPYNGKLRGTGALPGFDPTDNTQVGSIATQNLGGNSLTQALRSLQNYMATQGQSTFDFGQGIVNAGIGGFGSAGAATDTAMGTTNKALGTTDEAMGTSRGALSTLAPAESYWSKLLSGDQQTMNEAISPYATQAGTNYANANNKAATTMPRGGFSASLSANLPFAQARDVNEQLYKLQPQAATNLNTIAGTKNTIAGTQGQIGGIQNTIAGTQGNIAAIKGQLSAWLSSIGIDVSKLGAGFLDAAAQNMLGGRGQDVTEHGQAMSLAGDMSGGVSQGYAAKVAAGG